MYEFQTFSIDECAPPEYERESGNIGNTKVQLIMPFDMHTVEVKIGNEIIFADKDVPANSPIYIICDCDLSSEDDIAFTMTCATDLREIRIYEYKKEYTMLDVPKRYALVLKKQKFKL